jgi:hypothetical protein
MSQTRRQRESLVLYKSLNTPCQGGGQKKGLVFPYMVTNVGNTADGWAELGTLAFQTMSMGSG